MIVGFTSYILNPDQLIRKRVRQRIPPGQQLPAGEGSGALSPPDARRLPAGVRAGLRRLLALEAVPALHRRWQLQVSIFLSSFLNKMIRNLLSIW